MLKKFWKPRHQVNGFTMVETCGVLAITGILMAVALPKIYDAVASTDSRALAAAARTYETAILSYYGDMRTLYPLNAAGLPQAELGGQSTTTRSLPARLKLNKANALNVGSGSWSSFQGPYLEKFDSANPPGLGATMAMPSRAANFFGVAPRFDQFNFDLDGDNANDINNGSPLVYLFVDDIPQARFEEIDAILDPGIGANLAERQVRGRVKWQADGDGQLRFYLMGAI